MPLEITNNANPDRINKSRKGTLLFLSFDFDTMKIFIVSTPFDSSAKLYVARYIEF